MKSIRYRFFAVAAIVVSCLQASTVEAETFTCNFDVVQGKKYVPSQVTIEIYGKYHDVRVSDAFISKYHGEWIEGSIQTSTQKRMTLTWQLSGIPKDPLDMSFRTRNFTYALTVMKSNLSATLSVNNSVGYSSSFRATGRCTTVK